MATSAGTPIVVGLGEDPSCRAALAWAADEASRRRLPLRLVFVRDRLAGRRTSASAPRPDGERPDAAEETLRTAVAAVRRRHPRLDVTALSVAGAPVPVLRGQSRTAAAVVLGARRPAGRPGPRATGASVTLPVIARAACPVVVVPEPVSAVRRKPLFVVGVDVGLDGRRHSADALHHAFVEATRHGAALRVLHVWRTPLLGSLDETAAVRECRLLLSQMVAGCKVTHPDVEVRCAVLRGPPARVLSRESAGALGLVVGARGPGGSAARATVIRRVLRQARCPVLAVPRRETYPHGRARPHLRRLLRWPRRAAGRYARMLGRAAPP